MKQLRSPNIAQAAVCVASLWDLGGGCFAVLGEGSAWDFLSQM
jgi:hypothetical protein